MIVSWGLGKDLDLNFEIFMVVLLVLTILVVGNFLRDGSSNYLEGALLVVSRILRLWSYTDSCQIVYVIIAMTAWFYPNAELTTSNGSGGSNTGGELAKRMVEAGTRFMN